MKPGSRMVGDDHFWSRTDRVAALYRWLVDHQKLDTTDKDAVEKMLREPWQFAAEFQAMQAVR